MSAAFKIESEDQALAILAAVEEISRKPPKRFTDPDFEKQDAFIQDRATFKAAKCTRRAGKSMGVGLWLLEPVYESPEPITSLYLSKTRQSAEEIMWRDVVKAINRNLELGFKANEVDLSLTNTVTESKLRLAGADASPDEMTKYLGGKLKRVGIDEAAAFRQDLNRLVYEILYPALADHDGQLALISTTDQLKKGLFYEITRPELDKRRKGWSVHEWTSLDNPYMRDKILKQIAKLKEDNPRIHEVPWFQRQYLNMWATDDQRTVYRYDQDRNDIHVVPTGGNRLRVLGLDLGFTDATAFAIADFGLRERRCDFIDCYKKSGMTISDVAERLDYYQKVYQPYAMIVDGAAKQAVEELKQRFGFPLIAADKMGKAEIIEIFNSELLAGRIGYFQPAMQPITSEYPDLIWDEKSTKREEHPGCENHGADACLYAWRHCFYHLAQPIVTEHKTEEQQVLEHEEREAEIVEMQRKSAFWER